MRCPTLVVCGERDSVNMKAARFFAQNIRDAELRIIEGAGHVVNEEKPEALARALDEFYGAY